MYCIYGIYPSRSLQLGEISCSADAAGTTHLCRPSAAARGAPAASCELRASYPGSFNTFSGSLANRGLQKFPLL